MAAAFKRLGFAFKGPRPDASPVTPPSATASTSRSTEDLIEEVARLHGFERIAAHPPRVAASMLAGSPMQSEALHSLRERLAASDYREVINFSFVEPAWEADFRRRSESRAACSIRSRAAIGDAHLADRLAVSKIQYNHARKVPRIRVFEVGRVFLRDPARQDGPLSVGGLRQPMRIAAAAYGPSSEQWGRGRARGGFLRREGGPGKPGRAARGALRSAGAPALPSRALGARADRRRAAGWIGELHPKWLLKYEPAAAPILFELEAEPLQAVPLPRPGCPRASPRWCGTSPWFFALETPVQAVFDAIQAEKPAIVRSAGLLSVFRGPGIPADRKSLAFRVVMQDTERTLTDAEADAARDALVALLGRKFAATIRT
jgi:phenylalanyl-tRNA synthetase beta chain